MKKLEGVKLTCLFSKELRIDSKVLEAKGSEIKDTVYIEKILDKPK